MKWEGIKIKELARNNKLSIQSLADRIGVSRQTVNDWIKGQIPKGNHLLLICKLFSVDPDYFFIDDTDSFLSVPVHRTQRRAQITPEMQDTAKILSNEYSMIFRNHVKPSVLPVIRTQGLDDEAAIEIAARLRQISGIAETKPIDYQHTFQLGEQLGIFLIFRYFPKSLKGYAFFTRIYGHRVVFISCDTSIIDLIFPVLHEFVHAIRDEKENEYDKAEENFCDLVACKIQFPDEYLEMVFKAIQDLKTPMQINKLKEFARINSHSIHGIFKAIKYQYPDFTLSYGGADTNLRKEFPTIGEIIFHSDDSRDYVYTLGSLSSNFLKLISIQLDSISNRRLAELLGLESSLDSKDVRIEILRTQAVSNN
jgi:transcriptional regulator with XRE-family HTH domain